MTVFVWNNSRFPAAVIPNRVAAPSRPWTPKDAETVSPMHGPSAQATIDRSFFGMFVAATFYLLCPAIFLLTYNNRMLLFVQPRSAVLKR